MKKAADEVIYKAPVNAVTEHISALKFSQVVQLCDDYDQLERDGKIGECVLRTEAEKLMRKVGASTSGVALWMDRLAFEGWRFQAQLMGAMLEEAMKK